MFKTIGKFESGPIKKQKRAAQKPAIDRPLEYIMSRRRPQFFDTGHDSNQTKKSELVEMITPSTFWALAFIS